jgi:hypothetical protein
MEFCAKDLCIPKKIRTLSTRLISSSKSSSLSERVRDKGVASLVGLVVGLVNWSMGWAFRQLKTRMEKRYGAPRDLPVCTELYAMNCIPKAGNSFHKFWKPD